MNYFLSTTLTLFLVMDALGTLPLYLSALQSIPKEQRAQTAVREIGLSLVMLFIFFYLGDLILRSLNIDDLSVEVSGGVVLLIIATRFIFSKPEGASRWEPGRHLVVPIATPIIASPSVFAVLMIYAYSPIPDSQVIIAMFTAWFISAVIYLFAAPIQKAMKDQGLLAIQRFIGLIVALVAVQKILHGLTQIFGS